MTPKPSKPYRLETLGQTLENYYRQHTDVIEKSSAKTYQEDTTDTMAVTYAVSTGPQHRDQKRGKYL